MGCVASKDDMNESSHNVFHVLNVDDMGHRMSHGQLEVTENELVLHQKGKEPIRWPLKCLRRYGFDAELFSFESGRRCPTGAAIYAFRCLQAQQLFSILQEYINSSRNNEDNSSLVLPNYFPPTSPGSDNNGDAGYAEQTRQFNSRGSLSLSQAPSATSRAPLSPTGSLPANAYYVNEDVFTEEEQNIDSGIRPPYANLDGLHYDVNTNVLDSKDMDRLYMNVMPETKCRTPISVRERFYANLGLMDLNSAHDISVLPMTTAQMNYIVLDLKRELRDLPTSQSMPLSPLEVQCPDSSRRKSQGYVTIDFNKTAALSNSANPSTDDDEGCRKTRHNSNMNSMISRHNSTMSGEL